jgi:hypothetical protein
VAHYGIDVSSNNPHPLNVGALYSYLKGLGGGGQPFAIVKATQGTGYVNPDFAGDVAALKAAGFAVGAYLMDQGNNAPGTEENVFKNVAGGIPQFDDDELPEGLSVAAYKAHLAVLVAQANVIQYLNQSEVAEGFPEGAGLWLAQYNGLPGVTVYSALIHQYTSTGTVPGVVGPFDLNYFMGSEAQFTQFFGGTTPAPAPIPAPALLAFTNRACTVPTGGALTTRADGTVDTFDGARFYGALVGHALNAPIVGICSTPTGNGYWLVGTDGGVFAFGDAAFYGSLAGQHINAAVVGITASPSGHGYWLAAADGGVFAFGDAAFHGSAGGQHLNAPVIGIQANGDGYYLFASDGGVDNYGAAPFYGSAGAHRLNSPVIAGQVTPTGKGYRLFAEDGGVFCFGDATYLGPIPKYMNQWNLGTGHAIPITGAVTGNSSGTAYTIFGDVDGVSAMPYRIPANGSLTS